MYHRLSRCSLVLLLILMSCVSLFAQQRTVTGIVRNQETQEPLSGVTVSIKGSTKSTTTNGQGEFTIAVPSNETVLKLSYVGFTYQEITVGNRSTIAFALTPDKKQLDDVVVVGYGTKKRANLLGAVSSIKPEEIEDLPVANLGTALVGRVPGIGVSVASGKPGATTTITIRNPTLFAASGRLGLTQDPLFVIDGLTVTKQDFDNLDASLVESISFLKDASAAVYGASGDKGVVLVTTKKGKPGKAKISYSAYYGATTATTQPKILSAYDHAKLLNDQYIANNDADNKKFSQADLDFLATNPYQSWYDQLWKPANLMRHTINVSGGTDKVTFFAGGNTYDESGNFGDISIKKYGIRSGMNAKISESVNASISLNTDYSTSNRNTLKGSSTETEDLMARALFLTPGWVPLTVNGLPNNWKDGPNPPGAWNPVALFNSDDYEKTNSQGLSLNTSLEYKPLFLKGLTAKVQFGKLNRSGTSKQYFPSYTVYNFKRTGQNGLLFTDTTTGTSKISNTDRLQEGTNYNNSYQLIGSLDYAAKIKKHEFDLLALTEQSEADGDSYLTYRNAQQIPGVDQMYAFDQSTTTVQLNGASESGKRSYLARLNYNYDSKYLLEFVGRYDGSANFPPDKRWGFFPALGLGWRISEERFFKDNINFITSLKLRANVGLVGDDRVTGYQYVARFTQTTGMLFGSTVTSGLDPNIYPNPDITWEKARTQNYGLDAAFLNNKITLGIDIWNRHTFDGFDDLASVSLPYTVGISAGLKNYGVQNAWGSEITVGYRGKIGKEWGFNIDANFGTSNNQVIASYYSPSRLGGITEYQDIMIGKSSRTYTSSNYGYIAKGILRTQDQVDAILAKNPNYKINGIKPQVGFLDFVDVNNDGVIDGNDITVMYDNVSPVLGAGITLGVTYKTFRLNTNIGLSIGGKKFFDSEARKTPTTTQSAPDFWADHWTPDNPNAKYPRADAPLAKENSTFWAISGTTARVNNMTISYSLPKRISDKFRIPDFRAFASGTNLWNLVNPYKYKDPSTSNFAAYPTLRTISVGLNVTL
jgi:TonB-dependent starch-binding outer membrane protein SusC